MRGSVEPVPGLTPGAVSLRAEMASGEMPLIGELVAGDTHLEFRQGWDTLWLIVRRKDQKKSGGFALRTAHAPGMPLEVSPAEPGDNNAEFRVKTHLGEYQVRVQVPDTKVSLVRCTVRLTPKDDLLLPFMPRDLYPIDAKGNPACTQGQVYAGQRGLNGGLLFLSLKEPEFGSLLYFQNFTALNEFFIATDTKPDGVVGGQWPELGYQPPTAPQGPVPPTHPLPKGKTVTISDAVLNFSTNIPENAQQMSRLFLDLLAGVYVNIERPETEYHDWLTKVQETLRDLDESPKATINHYGNRYIHPYTASEYPDSMVQMTVATTMREYAEWEGPGGRATKLSADFVKGMPKFYDEELKTIRRYLPNVGKDKNADEVDSWYLYHPLINLGRLAKHGDETARELFLNSLEFGIKVAQRFDYQWPVQYNIKTLEVIKDHRKEGEPGQSDVAGVYATVMVLAWDLTGDSKYLDEARKSLEAITHLGFNMAYQMNLTAWGMNACIRLYRMTQDAFYRDMSLTFLANYLHNCILWESDIKNAGQYRNFLGATCLHDGPYMAIYECFESLVAFEEYLSLGQDDVPDSVRLLLTEYYKYTLTRAWYYYPSELPEEALAKEIRNGHIDRALAFPLEDLYADGQPAGQVGQEIYGCGATFAFVTRAYHRAERMPFLLYCEYPLSELEEREERSLGFEVRGADGFDCRVRMIPQGKNPIPTISLYMEDQTAKPNRTLRGKLTAEGHCAFTVPANQRLLLRWDDEDAETNAKSK